MRLCRDGKVADGCDGSGDVFAVDVETEGPGRIRRLRGNDLEAVLHFGSVKTKEERRNQIIIRSCVRLRTSSAFFPCVTRDLVRSELGFYHRETLRGVYTPLY